MTRTEALTELHNGNKITHKHFMSDEYLEIKNEVITSEDGYDFTESFWKRSALKDGWAIFNN